MLNFNTDTDALEVYLVHNVTGAVFASIYGPATSSEVGSVILTFSSPASPVSQTFSAIGMVNRGYLFENRLYIAVYSTSFPGGAIRGQIVSIDCPLVPCTCRGNRTRRTNFRSQCKE